MSFTSCFEQQSLAKNWSSLVIPGIADKLRITISGKAQADKILKSLTVNPHPLKAHEQQRRHTLPPLDSQGCSNGHQR